MSTVIQTYPTTSNNNTGLRFILAIPSEQNSAASDRRQRRK